MRKTKVLIILFLFIATISVVLLYNKSKMETKTNGNESITTPVFVAKVTKEKLKEQLTFVGTISANNDVAIISETQGKVVTVFANVGDVVSAGAPLVQIDDEIKKANFATAEVNFEKAKKDFERIDALNKDKSVTESQLEAAGLGMKSAEAQYVITKRQMNDAKISSPISGIVTARTVDIGTMVQSGMTIANVVDISKLKVKISIPEKDVFKLRIGSTVEITTEVYPGISFTGNIENISAKGDEVHTYPVEISFPNNKEHPLKAGMFARVLFLSQKGNESLLIPREALIGSLKNAQVFVVNNTVAKLRKVIASATDEGTISVQQGLEEGEIVVVTGQNILKDNTVVSVIKK